MPISRSRDTRPPSWSIVTTGSTSLRSRRSSTKLPQLRRRLDVAPEQDEPARLQPPQPLRRLRVQFRPRHPHQQQLIRIHALPPPRPPPPGKPDVQPATTNSNLVADAIKPLPDQ